MEKKDFALNVEDTKIAGIVEYYNEVLSHVIDIYENELSKCYYNENLLKEKIVFLQNSVNEAVKNRTEIDDKVVCHNKTSKKYIRRTIHYIKHYGVKSTLKKCKESMRKSNENSGGK